ncbi:MULTISPECIES: hypothetical protein [Pseudomonas]|uniref:hypothetical protein n=1 Tax=Pseudomonas TaxID=286 RepID=UPI001FF15BA5|nr:MULTISPECIES: hypothetical protein [Pseudomonas]
MLFAKNLLLKLPRLKQSLKEAETNSFSPISILSKSSAQLTIEFKSDRHTGTYLNPEGDIRVDLLYNCSSRGWQTIGSYNPYYYGVEDDNQDPDGIIEYSLLDSEVSRVKAHKALSEPKIGIYKGVSGKYLGFYFMKPIYFFRRTITYPIKILNLSRILVGIFFSQTFHGCITFPLILSKSKSLPKVSFRPAKTHLIDNTKQALDKIKIHIENLSEKINLGAADRAKILIRSEGEGFMLSRGNLTIKFYKSGDGYIRANDTGGYPQMFAFSMELTEHPFGVKLWKVNKKTMSLKTACIHIMDSFILLAH